MGKTVSIAITAKDNFSTAITTMKNSTKTFAKDVSGLQHKMDTLNRTKATLKVDADKARRELREAEKQFAAAGDAISKLSVETANINYENARRNLSLVSAEAKEAEKEILNLTSALSKSENRASGGMSTGFSSLTKNLTQTIVASGLASSVGSILSDLSGTYVASAYGSEGSSYLSGTLSGAGMGAAIGTAIAPGIGTAVGAILGGIVGIAQGAVEVFKDKDEAFKSYYQEQYESVTEAQKDALENGSTIAANREQMQISFATLLGSDKAAQSYLGEMTAFGAQTPFTYDTLASISKTLLAYNYSADELLPLLTNVGNAGSALGMGTEDMTYIATYMGRMKSTGKTTMEYLNPLLERGIDVYAALAKMPEAAGKTNAEIQEMVSDGLIPGEEAAKAISDYMSETYAGSMEKQSQTYSGLQSTLEDVQDELDNAMGEGYNEVRSTGIQEQIDYLGGEAGASMQDAYNKIGQWQASLENLSEQYERDAFTSITSGLISSSFSGEAADQLSKLSMQYRTLESSDAEDAGAQMGAILAEAQVIAQNEYNASEGAQLELASQMSLVQSIRSDAALQTEYWNFGYQMGQEFSKGLKAAQGESDFSYSNWSEELYNTQHGTEDSGYAYGISYVPYDNFPAILHEGEGVLTASENRARGRGGVSVLISGNSFTVREDADIEKVAREIARQFNRAAVLSV